MTDKRDNRLHFALPAHVDEELRRIAESAGLSRQFVAIKILSDALADGTFNLDVAVIYDCPYSAARLRELLYIEHKSLLDIAKMAQIAMDWAIQPPVTDVKRWIAGAGIEIKPPIREPIKLTRETRARKSAYVSDGVKRCSKCREPKPITDFYRDSHTADGYDHLCKGCKRTNDPERNRSYYQEHKEELKQRARERKRMAKQRLTGKSPL